jgi:Acyl-CoA synthetases (AMP-forming)/AMP-acid ligases II
MTPSALLAAARVSAHAGLLSPPRPDRAWALGRALRYWGPTLAGGFAANAARYPDRLAVVDERGGLTYRELHRRTNAQANALRARDLGAGAKVGVLCRNHAGFVEATAALAKLGADAVSLGTGFSAPQLRVVLERERVVAVIHDEEFTAVLDGAAPQMVGFVAWHDGPSDRPTLDDLANSGDPRDPPRPIRIGRTIILTSGTTGTPKGAPREQRSGVGPALALLSAIPMRSGDVNVIAAPLFHSWGFGHLTLGLLLGSTAVLRRRFDSVDTLAAVAANRAQGLVAVPVMLRRILAVPEMVRVEYDTSSLRYVAVSGSALPGRLAPDFMDVFGDIVYNLYGSTEVAYGTLAGPADLRAAPSTAGRPLPGATIEIRDQRDEPVPTGARGRIFVANSMLFAGYTDGGTRTVVRGLMSTGDVGHLDEERRLFVEGREDDMIVSGGENVFPEEVEQLLLEHAGVADAAVVGVSDPEFGERLEAYVVLASGASPTADDLRAYVRDHLARHKVPREVVFVDELPRNPTGKVVRRWLPSSGGSA